MLCLQRAPSMQPQQPGCSAQSYVFLARSASALPMRVTAQMPTQTQPSTSQRQLASRFGQQRRLPTVSAEQIFFIVKDQPRAFEGGKTKEAGPLSVLDRTNGDLMPKSKREACFAVADLLNSGGDSTSLVLSASLHLDASVCRG